MIPGVEVLAFCINDLISKTAPKKALDRVAFLQSKGVVGYNQKKN